MSNESLACGLDLLLETLAPWLLELREGPRTIIVMYDLTIAFSQQSDMHVRSMNVHTVAWHSQCAFHIKTCQTRVSPI